MLDGHVDLADRLLDHLRVDLDAPGLAYAEAPVPMSGGYDTRIFSFRLAGGPEGWAPALVLRLQNPLQDPRRALVERAVQGTVASLGYPAPRVFHACADPAVLGGGFLVMERVAGRPLIDEQRVGLAAVLVELQTRLHALDARPVLDALDRLGSRASMTFDGLLATFQERIARGALAGLRPAMDWLSGNRPRSPAAPAICHGDFHPQNILMSNGAVTAVLDWPNTVIADPAYDVAATRIILRRAPVELLPIPAALRPVVRLARVLITTRYLAGYRRRRPIEPAALRYYEAAACMRQLVRVWGTRVDAAARRAPLGVLDASRFGEDLAARFSRLTGVPLALPKAA